MSRHPPAFAYPDISRDDIDRAIRQAHRLRSQAFRDAFVSAAAAVRGLFAASRADIDEACHGPTGASVAHR